VTLVVTPALFSLLLWKSVYEYEGNFYVDAVRAGLAMTPLPGETIAKLDAPRDFPWLEPSSQQARDVARFTRVANGFVAVDKAAADRVIDLRYSLVPNEIAGFWAIVLDPSAGPVEHVDYITTREQAPEQARRLLAMLF
jgi:inner membrane protein